MQQRPQRPGSRRGTSTRLNLILSAVLMVIVIAIAVVLVLSSRDNGDTPETPTAVAEVSPTVIATPEDETPTEVAEEPTAEATEPAATPTPVTPTPTVEPTPTPIVGDFGDLPAAEMPTGNSAGRPISLDYRLDMSMQLVPQQAAVYEISHRSWTLDEVTALADALGLTGEVVDQGGGSYRVSGGGSLYVTGDIVQYAADPAAEPVPGPLPTDDILIQSAKTWLIKHQLVGADAGPGRITLRNTDMGLATVVIKPVEPEGILSAIPSASVTVAADGTVVQADVRWPAALRTSTYGLRSPEALWDEVRGGRGYLELDPGLLPTTQGALQGSATITSASIAYTLAGTPGMKQFLVPAVVFSGQAQIEGADQPVPVKVYVPAVSAQAAPRG